MIASAIRNSLTLTMQLALTLSAVTWSGEAKAGPPEPAKAEALRELEQRVRVAALKALPAVVAVELATAPGAPTAKHHVRYGSGVLITPDGLILSQYHVTHGGGSGDVATRRVGERLKVLTHDGAQLEAELLGGDRGYDVSLLRLVGHGGPYPHAPLDGRAAVKLGDRVLKLGHPNGYRRGRAPVVRLGRVLVRHDDAFISDCLVSGGDSGGPLFDLDGRLVGIIWSGWTPEPLAAVESNARRTGVPFTSTSGATIAERLDAMRAGKILEPDADAIRRTTDRLRAAATLPAEEWSQGTSVAGLYRHVVARARDSVVTVRCGADAVALGTVVGADGWIVTKASALLAEPTCHLPDGRVLGAEIVGIEPAFDVALLKVAASGLKAIEWADGPDPSVGAFIAAPGDHELPLAVGVVSVPRRDMAGPFPTRLSPPRRAAAAPPEVIGSAVQGRGYWVEFVEGEAAAAGIMPGDVILTLGGRDVRSHQDLFASVKGRQRGERVTVRLIRAGKTATITLSLRADGQSASIGPHADGFPTVVEHDVPLWDHEFGGPVVDLSGAAIGITIARAGPHGCMSVPGDRIERLLPDLKSGKLAGNWTAYRDAMTAQRSASVSGDAKPGAPVDVTLDELKQRLDERADRFRSLLVEYEVVSEAHVEPRLLLGWGLHLIRDDQERHVHAFAEGNRRYARVTRPEVTPAYAPRDQVGPDPNAPKSVADEVERDRRSAAGRKAQGSSAHLFVHANPDIRSLFDGNECFAWDPLRKSMRPSGPGNYYAPLMYLANLGLQPLDPRAVALRPLAQQKFRFPANFPAYERCRLLPNEELVDGAPCVVVEAEYHGVLDGQRRLFFEKIWFDPRLGFAPRKWQQRLDGAFHDERTNSEFEEFTRGCWLPRQSVWTVGTPLWVAPELRDRPAYSYRMRLIKAQVNDVGDEVFQP